MRYDRHAFTPFTTADGLGHNTVWSIFQDREGRLWFTTYGGVSRYERGDRKTFTTFTTKDGLIHDVALSIGQDGEGNLWFGTEAGLSRYDGQT